MWWSRRRVLGLVPVVALLAGCGFKPMYGGRAGRSTAAELAKIKVATLRDRVGQIFRNNLIERLSPRGEPREPRYRLQVEVTQNTVPIAIQLDTTITRYNLRLNVNFALIDATTKRVLYRDRTRAVGSYNAVRSDFATLSAELDTARRAAREASEQVRTLLSVFFARQLAS